MHRIFHIAVGCLLAVAVATGCVETDWEPVEPPTYAESHGGLGEYDVLKMERRYRVRVDETVRTRIFVPARADAPIRDGFPVVLFAHGGAVRPDRYDWLCAHMASRGFVVLAPRHAIDLPILAQGNILDVLHTARRAAESANDPLKGVIGGGKTAAIGHSLGGVVAATAWLNEPGKVSHLGLLASYPNGAERVDRLTPPSSESEYVLSIIGSNDGLLDVEQAAEELEPIEAPHTLAVVEGMNHFQFTDGIKSSESGRDDEAAIDTQDGRTLVLFLVDGWLDDFANGDERRLRNSAAWPDGLVTGEAFLDE
jgi:pimeloyl-ACP methyl ester carboxylesterase